MPKVTALASTCGLIAGIALTVTVHRDPLPPDPAGGVIASIALRLTSLGCLLLVVGTVLRRWLAEHTATTGRYLTTVAQQTRVLPGGGSSGRQAPGDCVELAELRKELAAERTAHEHTQAEYKELAAEYNRLVISSVQRCADSRQSHGRPAVPKPGRRAQTAEGRVVPQRAPGTGPDSS